MTIDNAIFWYKTYIQMCWALQESISVLDNISGNAYANKQDELAGLLRAEAKAFRKRLVTYEKKRSECRDKINEYYSEQQSSKSSTTN